MRLTALTLAAALLGTPAAAADPAAPNDRSDSIAMGLRLARAEMICPDFDVDMARLSAWIEGSGVTVAMLKRVDLNAYRVEIDAEIQRAGGERPWCKVLLFAAKQVGGPMNKIVRERP